MNQLFDQFAGRRSNILITVYVCCTLLVMNVTSSARADEGQLSLSNVIEELATHSPEIRAARQRWESAKAVVPQVQTLPDPRLQFGYQRMPMVPPVVEGVMYGIGQDIPFPGKLKLKGEVAQREAERFEQEYLFTRLRVVSALKQIYYDLHFVHKSIEIVERNKGEKSRLVMNHILL